MDRAELADFLRRSRTRLTPADVGLPEGSRRRTPGLRREEVAQLAGMSADYYTRLEQQRGPHPSTQLLTALARALRLSADERDHLFHLAGQEPRRTTAPDGYVRPGLLLILDRLYDTPAQVVSALHDVLVQNAMAKALWGDASTRDPQNRNIIWRWFAEPERRVIFPAEDHDRLGRSHVAHLRAVSAARPDDPYASGLIRRLLAVSPEFAQLWAEHDVALRRSDVKRIIHPVVGELELDCEVLVTSPGSEDQRLLVHTARPGTESAERLALLRVAGLQDLSRAEPQAPPTATLASRVRIPPS